MNLQKLRPFAVAAAFLLLVTANTFSISGRAAGGPGGPGSSDSGSGADDANFDRLDGHGASGKKVHVIEWEGNLEIHVYPAGSLRGLALKLDQRNRDRPVMVIGYRFDNDPAKQLVRRAILGINLKEGFKTYKDPTSDEYDKIIVSNNALSQQVVAYKLDPEPKQLYPDGHPALAASSEPKPTAAKPDTGAPRKPASQDGDVSEDGAIRWNWSR